MDDLDSNQSLEIHDEGKEPEGNEEASPLLGGEFVFEVRCIFVEASRLVSVCNIE